MLRPTLNPDPTSLSLEAIHPDQESITIVLRTCRSAVVCPVCGQRTERVHSWYQRTLADLPWQGLAVRFQVFTRRWFCSSATCSCRIFTERLPQVMAPSARRTLRLTEVVEAVAFALGGEAGARLLQTLGMPLSPNTLLDTIRATVVTTTVASRGIGIDDWTWRRGHRYGTIIVDLERHHVVALLPDRAAETVRAWLQQHPEIEVIARDRGDAAIDAATSGAPQATQVADRRHLLKNLGERLEEFLLHQRIALRAATQPETVDPSLTEPDEAAVSAPGPLTPNRPRHRHERLEAASRQRHERLVRQDEAIRRLHLAGAAVADIARTVGVSRETVYRYRHLTEPPPIRQPHPRRRVIDPYVPYLFQRCEEGCHNGMQLWRDIREQGFGHGSSNVFRFLADLRRDEAAGRPADAPARRRTAPVCTARQVAILLLRRPAGLTAEQQAYLTALRARDENIATASRLVQACATMVRERQGEQLDAWLAEVADCEIPALRRFAAGLRRDLDAVRAGLTEPWSNGQTEGQVHRLKLLKR
ncbi:MAG: ISL3 family transposase [Chloroflexota bacterium]|nr:ISL3 family transposase [Chloroflexota bacterium]